MISLRVRRSAMKKDCFPNSASEPYTTPARTVTRTQQPLSHKIRVLKSLRSGWQRDRDARAQGRFQNVVRSALHHAICGCQLACREARPVM